MSQEPIIFYEYPAQKEQLLARYWRVPQAAKAWGCSRQTVYRMLKRCPEKIPRTSILVITPSKMEEWEVIPAGTPKPDIPPRGNPQFRNREWQREQAKMREERRRKAHPHT